MYLQPGKIHIRQATHIDGDAHCAGLGVDAFAEGCDPAVRAVTMIDGLPIEAVATYCFWFGVQLQLRARTEPERTAAAATQPTIAVAGLGRSGFGLQIARDGSAMTATGVVHVILRNKSD